MQREAVTVDSLANIDRGEAFGHFGCRGWPSEVEHVRTCTDGRCVMKFTSRRGASGAEVRTPSHLSVRVVPLDLEPSRIVKRQRQLVHGGLCCTTRGAAVSRLRIAGRRSRI